MSERLHMFVWSRETFFFAVAQATSVAEARDLLLKQVEAGSDSTPERNSAADWIKETTPTIWHFANAEFALTDSAELREADRLNEKLGAELRQLHADLAAAQALNEQCMRYSEQLLHSRWPELRMTDDMLGRLMQIDNGFAVGMREVERELAEAKGRVNALTLILGRLRRGDCWCDVGIGNPMMSGHSGACIEAQKALKSTPEGEKQ